MTLDYSGVDSSTPGTYDYTVTCLGDCGGDTDEGTVTVVEFCVATAPDFSICQDTTVNDQLFLDHGASCTAGCTVSLSYSFDGSTVGAYTYTVTCLGDCGGDTDEGTVTVVEFCVATAPDFSICQDTTVNDQLFLDHGASCTAGCTVSLSYSFDGSTVGAYTYTVTCLGDCGGDTDEGTVTVVEFCVATAPDFSICQDTTVNDQLFLDHGASCTAGCTVSLSYSFDGSTVGAYTYTVTCLGDCGGDTDEGTVTVVEFCVATAADFSICQDTTVNDQLFLDHGASCTAGCTVSLSYSFDGSTVGAYTYTVTCLGDCGGDTDEGTVTVRDCAPPVIVSMTQSNDEPCAGEDVTITAHVTDDAGVTTVTLTYTTSVSMSLDSGTAQDGYWKATIPGQPACTTLSIFVTARDAEGNEVSSTPHEKHWKDCAPPVIVSVTQSNDEPCAGEDVVITAHVTDDVGVTAVNLTYNGTTVPMTLSSGTAKDGNWTAIIPGQPADTTLTIYVTATDGENTVSSTPHEKHWKDCAPEVELEKAGSPATVAPGGDVTYTINYTNTGAVPLHDVVITEHYPKGVTFISASPAPDAGTNNVWTKGTLLPGESRTIVIKVKVPEQIDLSFTETGSVIGEGLVMVTKDLSTEQKPYWLKNRVTLSCDELDPVSAYATTKVSGVPGTSLGITESGSGLYSSDEILDLETTNKSIILKKTTHAEYKPTSFDFSDSFSVNFTNKWKQDICSRNMEIDAAIHKKISDATYIDDETISRVDKDKSIMNFDSSFNGSLYIGARTKDTAISETYIGEFDVLQTIQIAKGPIPTPSPTPTPIWLPCPYNDSQGNTTEDAEPTP
uniref:DUF11 domain-containing protein n=1 Tax=Candidatus Methanophaga sp. ANME-1 ERB7 TaxID=2759913 RepID=A0A7G9Z4A2_9EURY|nr:hypothetical protein PBMGCBEP_00021 [Methanosarcinales archaeon ANME-1 ERB7]